MAALSVLTQVLDHINNYFYHGEPVKGEFTISSGALTVEGLQGGQYYDISGSVFNDGIHIYGQATLTDETFTGIIHPMAVPPAVIAIADDVDTWITQYGDVMNSPYQSENVIGVYSYETKHGNSSSSSANDDGGTWQSVFARRLDAYRKVSGR